MNVYESGENYLEAILMLEQKLGNVRSIDVANELGFSKPSVSVAIKNFKKNDLVCVDELGYIKLTHKGKEIAERVLERHQTFTTILKALGVADDIADIDACKLEHAVSDESYQKFKDHFNKSLNLNLD